jgi:hypothetical protein
LEKETIFRIENNTVVQIKTNHVLPYTKKTALWHISKFPVFMIWVIPIVFAKTGFPLGK